MKVQVLASGSKGNCTYIESNNTKILIDTGITFSRLKEMLLKIDVNINSLNGILISHTHKDHISGLSSILKKVNIPVFIKEEIKVEIEKISPYSEIEIIDKTFYLGDFYIEVINASHDVPAFGFILNDEKSSLLYLTDTGYINRKYYELCRNKSIYVIESNHDEKMLMEGKYPYILKQRVISDKGHLSNRTTGKFLSKVIGNDTKYVILAHLSEHNNLPELALQQVREELIDNNVNMNNILIAKQYEETEMVEI